MGVIIAFASQGPSIEAMWKENAPEGLGDLKT